MPDMPNIEGVPDPRKAAELRGDDPVDPDKFKRMLKVEESDEAQKRHSRRKPKAQEEDEDVNKTEKETTATPGAFGAHMDEKKKVKSPFDAGAGTKAPIKTSAGDDLGNTPLSLLSSKKPSQPSSLNLESASPNKPSEAQPAAKSAKIEKPAEAHATKEDIQKAIDDKTKTATTDKIDTSFAAPPPPAQPITSAPAPVKPDEPAPTPPISHDTETSLMKDQQKKEEKQAAPFVLPETTDLPISTQPLLTTETPAYANLSPQVFELFERMVGLMTIQSLKGISITTVTLSMPGSVFNGCEIVLECYDTAPGAFNVQLLGNPQAVELFTANMQGLSNAFAQSSYGFQVNLRRPNLLDAYRPLTHRKENAGDEDDSPQQHG